ncbi:hypothetical protein ABZ541_29265 [Micromonospora sediminicola]|uniref:hypothetical protein n=1 Tax=Micromonospora sediminicola TaxID=946078 RepID=UPI0033E5663D
MAAPPWLLVALTGVPMRLWPSGPQLRDWLADPLTPGSLRAGLIGVAWLLWLGLAYTVAVTAARRLRAGARWLRHLPLPTPWQAAATSIAGAAALTTAHTPTSHPPALPTPVTADDLHPIKATAVERGGVVVPGGWLPDDTAHHIAAAAALVWLRRRRAHQPGQPDTAATQLAPLPATATAVQAAVANHPPATAATSATLADLPPAGLRLAGDGAADAARGLLVTRLLAALRDPRDTAAVIITRTALAALLPTATGAHRTISGLHAVDTLEHAAALQPSLTTPSAADCVTPTLLLSTDPSTAVPLTIPADARVVTLGHGTAPSTWHVDHAGHTHDRHSGQPRARMCVLDSTATADLLAVLAQPIAAEPDDTTTTGPARRIDPGAKIPRQASRTPPDTARQQPVAADSAVQMRVLGRPALLIDQHPVTIRRSAAWQILVFLAVHPDGATTGQLVNALWPGLPAHTVTGRLYTTLSDLRSAIRATGAREVVVHTEDRYHLDHRTDVDLWRLQTTAHHATITRTLPGWRTVIDTYTGDLAAGHTWPWIDPPREATRRLVLDAYTHAAAAQADPHERLRLLQEAIRVDPYNQHLHQLTADQLNALGDPIAAAHLLHTHQQRLHLAGILDRSMSATH